MPIREIDIISIGVRDVNVYTFPTPHAFVPYQPITATIGTPIVDMPGCVEAHEFSDKNNKIIEDDSSTVKVFCDAGMPGYTAMNFEPEQLLITQPQQVPVVRAPEVPETKLPETPKVKGDPECPGPNALRVGDIATNQKEKVSGHELRVNPQNPGGAKICVTLYEDIPPVEQFLPTGQVAATTAVIGVTAASSALLAKPLADLILRVVKPAVKKVISKIQTTVGKTPTHDRPSLSLMKTNAYRQKKGLPPLKKR